MLYLQGAKHMRYLRFRAVRAASFFSSSRSYQRVWPEPVTHDTQDIIVRVQCEEESECASVTLDASPSDAAKINGEPGEAPGGKTDSLSAEESSLTEPGTVNPEQQDVDNSAIRQAWPCGHTLFSNEIRLLSICSCRKLILSSVFVSGSDLGLDILRDNLNPTHARAEQTALLCDYVENLGEVDLLSMHVYTRCTLNPGGALDRLAAGAEKALETSSVGAIWFTRLEMLYAAAKTNRGPAPSWRGH